MLSTSFLPRATPLHRSALDTNKLVSGQPLRILLIVFTLASAHLIAIQIFSPPTTINNLSDLQPTTASVATDPRRIANKKAHFLSDSFNIWIDTDAVTMPPKRSRRAPRQTKLSFSPQPKPLPKRTKPPEESPAPPTKKQRLDVERETERGMKLGSPVTHQPLGMFGSSDVEMFSGSDSSDSESEDMPDTQPPPRRTKRTGGGRSPVRPPRKQGTIKTFVVPQEISTGSDDDDIPRTRQRAPPKPVRTPVRRRQMLPVKLESESDEDEEEDLPYRRSGGRQLPARSLAKRRQKSPEGSEQETDDDGEEEDSDDVPRSIQRRRTEKAAARDPQEQEDLEADLEFLRSSPPADKGGLRSRHSKPLTQREKALEALKRRRASSGGEPSSSIKTPGRKRAIVLSDSDVDSDSELEIVNEEDEGRDVEDEDESQDDDDTDSEVESETHGANALDMFHEDVDDVGFIDDDDGDLIGEPADFSAIPIQFTSLSRAKPQELFKYAVEWMVHKKINPAFPRKDEIYDLTFKKLDDEVTGLANSKFTSSVWSPDFTRALRARPNILFNEIRASLMDAHCEACNRKTHPATWEVHLTGVPYNRDTLEPLTADSDSSTSDSDASSSSSESETRLNGEKPTYDATGERILPESKVFPLGSHCKANAEVSHTLHHWRYHLNSWVVDYLVREGHCTPEKIIERDSWREKKREKYANKIVDKMEKEGEIKALHRLYKNQVDFAFEAKNNYLDGWGRNRGR